jgi:hypothetical protein
MTKRGKRRLRGKLSERQRVLVHYFSYSGVCEYTQAAMSYMDSDWIKRVSAYNAYWSAYNAYWRNTDVFPSYGYYHNLKNKTVHSFVIPFCNTDEAMVHVMERKLRMLQPEYNNGFYLYNYIPYKITVVRGHHKRQRTIHVTDLGTKV